MARSKPPRRYGTAPAPSLAQALFPGERVGGNVCLLPCASHNWLDQSRRGDMEQRLRRHWRRRCFLKNESAAMCARCLAPRIILRQGAARGVCPLAVVSVLHCSGQPSAVPPPSQPLQETSTSPPPDPGGIPDIQCPSVPKPLGALVLPRKPQDKRVDRHIDACQTSASHHTPSSTQHHRIVHQRTTQTHQPTAEAVP